jgi:hypothetical protein
MFERFRRSERDREARHDRGAVTTAEPEQERTTAPPPDPANRMAGRDRTEGGRRFERGHGDGGTEGGRFERDRDEGGHSHAAAATAAPAATTRETHREAVRDVRIRQRDEFGGFNLGAAFFGWLVAIGLAALLTALLAAAGTAIGLTEGVSGGDADEIGLAGGILFLCVLLLSYFAGGYVAGRMSRFDGGRQGLGVWIFGLLATIAIGVAGAIAGSEYNVLGDLNLPRIPIDEGDLTTGGIIALLAIVLGTLLAAMLGGKVGERYHRKIDRYGFREHERAVAH